MNYLNISDFNLTLIKNCLCILLCSLLFSCSSTQEVKNEYLSKNGYSNTYANGYFSHTNFTPSSKSSIKKLLHSDHHLMMSLLNRPITADQAMMIAFKQERENYSQSFSNYGVEIKGGKNSNESNYRAENSYSKFILQDTNAVIIAAPH